MISIIVFIFYKTVNRAVFTVGGVVLLSAMLAACQQSDAKNTIAVDNQSTLETATFAGGCFWCTEADFDKVPGVISTTSGYIGGTEINPTYEQVSAGATSHIEAVQVHYDPSKTSFSKLLTATGPQSIRLRPTASSVTVARTTVVLFSIMMLTTSRKPTHPKKQ